MKRECIEEKIVHCNNCGYAYCFGCHTCCPRCKFDVPLTTEEYLAHWQPKKEFSAYAERVKTTSNTKE